MRTTRKTEREQAAVAAWSFAHAVLWKNETFTEREVLHNRVLIEEQFERDATIEKNMIRFCVRVMMAKRYCDKNPDYRLPRPALWLNRNYTGGYNVTKQWYDELMDKRRLVAGYGQGLITLGRGFARYSQIPCREVFQMYRERLLHLKSPRFAQAFYNAIVYFNYQY